MAVATAHVKAMKDEGYLPASEAARAIECNPTTIYRWIERGLLRAKVLSGRNRFVSVEDLLELHEDSPAVQKAIRKAAR